MINYDKNLIKEQIKIDNIFDLLVDWGGEPVYQGDDIIVSRTICHNSPKDNPSRKLYYYANSNLFQCWTECGSFDIFELVIKVMRIQFSQEFDLNEAVRWIAYRFNISCDIYNPNEEELEDWKFFNKYNDLLATSIVKQIDFKNFNPNIINNFNYNLKLTPWLNEGITQEVLDYNHIGFYPGEDQITIPHYDINNNLIGIRGRTLCKDEAEKFGKYRPLKIQNVLYNHPLGMNLYNLNNAKMNIKKFKRVIVWEGEKSVLKSQSYFGIENDISVACCGSNLSAQQVDMLLSLGVEEIIIAFDKQWQKVNDNEFNLWTTKLAKINDKYKNYVKISFVFDKWNLLDYKDSPIDKGPKVFEQLLKKRIII